MKMTPEMKMNISDSIWYSIIMRFLFTLAVLARVGQLLFFGIGIAVTVVLYAYLRKGNRRPLVFIATMAITWCTISALLLILDLAFSLWLVFWQSELVLAGYLAVILLCDLIITKIIKSRKPSE